MPHGEVFNCLLQNLKLKKNLEKCQLHNSGHLQFFNQDPKFNYFYWPGDQHGLLQYTRLSEGQVCRGSVYCQASVGLQKRSTYAYLILKAGPNPGLKNRERLFDSLVLMGWSGWQWLIDDIILL